MIVIERRPPSIPVDPEDEAYWDSQFPRPQPVEPYPTAYLAGRVEKEDRLASVESAWEAGHSLGRSAIELLRQAQEFVTEDYDDYCVL